MKTKTIVLILLSLSFSFSMHSQSNDSIQFLKRTVNVAKSGRSDDRAAAIRYLGDLGDRQYLPVVLTALKTKNPQVVAAAEIAAAKISGKEAILPVLMAMQMEEPSVVKAGKEALLSLPDRKNMLDEIAPGIPPAAPLAKVALIEILGECSAKEYSGLVFANTASIEPVVMDAAYKALKSVVDPGQVTALLFKLGAPATSAQGKIPEVQDALVAAVKNSGTTDERVQLILGRLSNPYDLRLLYRPLALIGGEKAKEIILAGTKSDQSDVRSLAQEALKLIP